MNRFSTRVVMAAVMTILLLSGCSAVNELVQPPVAKHEEKKCPDRVAIDYVPMLKLNGITYRQNYTSDRKDINRIEKGKSVGKIRYSMSDNACLGYIMQDGDATILKEGTELYEVKGYASSARLWAGDLLYEATDNPKAKTINDLLDITGKIKMVRFISGMDGKTHLKDFTPEAVARFSETYPKLNYVPFDKVYKETKGWVGGKYWLEIELMDGSTFILTYNFKFAAFNPSGFATPELASLVEEQRKRIYAK